MSDEPVVGVKPKRKQKSKQRKWQIKMQKAGKCITCGNGPLTSRQYCFKHMIASRERQRIRNNNHRRYRSKSYQIEQEYAAKQAQQLQGAA